MELPPSAFYLSLYVLKFNTILFLSFTLLCSIIKAQPTLDTIKHSLKQRPQPFAKLDTKNSFIDNSRAKIMGAKLGLTYGKRVDFGMGYHQLYSRATSFDKQIYFVNALGKPDSATATLKMYYISVYAEYVFYKTKHWELSMPLQIGSGKSFYEYESGNKKKTDAIWHFIYEPAVSIEYKLVKWFGIGSEIGYRFMLTPERRLNQKFTSPTYAFSAHLYYNELFKLFKKKKE